MSFCCIVGGQMSHCIMDVVKFEFNDIMSLYTKNDYELRRFISVDILYYIYNVIIAIMVFWNFN